MDKLTMAQYKDFFDKNFTMLAYNRFKSAQPAYGLFCEEDDVDSWTVMGSSMSGLGVAEEVGAYDNPKAAEGPYQGFDYSISQKKYSIYIRIPDTVYNFISSPEALVNMFSPGGPNAGQVNELVAAIQRRFDVIVAGMLADADNNSALALAQMKTPDGLYIASAAHLCNDTQSTTWSNYHTANKTLTTGNLEDIITVISTVKNAAGQPSELLTYNNMRLVVGPSLGPLAKRIMQSQNYAGNAQNDKNVIPSFGMFIEPFIWQRLHTDYQGKNNTDWWVVLDNVKPFRLAWGKRPTTRSFIDELSGDYYFIAEGMGNVKAVEPRGIYMANSGA